jgi:hypothetical protein
MVFECPAYADERRVFFNKRGVVNDLEASPSNMVKIMNGQSSREWNLIASFIKSCNKVRSRILKVVTEA